MYKFDNGKFKEAHIWWDTEIDLSADVDVFYYIHDFKGRAEYKYGFKTLQVDLLESRAEIKSHYKPNLRNELRKSMEYDYKINFIDQPSPRQIKQFVELFNNFADYKNITRTSSDYLENLAEDNKLNISYIIYGGEILFGHSHYVAGGIARLFQSFSTQNSYDGKIVSLSNKKLTDADIFYFKSKCFNVYDFGGIGNVDGDNKKFEGIIKFKRSFGGNEVILWKGVTPNGKKGIKIINDNFDLVNIGKVNDEK